MTRLSLKGYERLFPRFFTNNPCFMTLTGDILGEQDFSLTKSPLITTAHLNFRFSFKSDNILPADNIEPWILIICRDFPEEEPFYFGRLRKKSKGATGFQMDINVFKMGLVVLSGKKSCNEHRVFSYLCPLC